MLTELFDDHSHFTMKKTIQSISIDQMAHLGVDEENRLYWRGVPVKTEQKVGFSMILNSAIVCASLATTIQAVCAVIALQK